MSTIELVLALQDARELLPENHPSRGTLQIAAARLLMLHNEVRSLQDDLARIKKPRLLKPL